LSVFIKWALLWATNGQKRLKYLEIIDTDLETRNLSLVDMKVKR
jgi:hypothetical protein